MRIGLYFSKFFPQMIAVVFLLLNSQMVSAPPKSSNKSGRRVVVKSKRFNTSGQSAKKRSSSAQGSKKGSKSTDTSSTGSKKSDRPQVKSKRFNTTSLSTKQGLSSLKSKTPSKSVSGVKIPSSLSQQGSSLLKGKVPSVQVNKMTSVINKKSLSTLKETLPVKQLPSTISPSLLKEKGTSLLKSKVSSGIASKMPTSVRKVIPSKAVSIETARSLLPGKKAQQLPSGVATSSTTRTMAGKASQPAVTAVQTQGAIVAPPKKKLSFLEELKQKAAEKAKKAAAQAKEKAKQSAEIAKIIGGKLKDFVKTFQEKMKKFPFSGAEATMFDATVDVSFVPPGSGKEPMSMRVGFSYPGFPDGPGLVSEPFRPIKGIFQPSSFMGIPLPIGMLLQQVPGPPGEMIKKLSTLSPELVFLLKVFALYNEYKHMSGDAADQEEALSEYQGAARNFFIANTFMLLARLAITKDPKTGQPLSPRMFVEKLLKPLKGLLDEIKIPGIVSAGQVEWFKQESGRPPTPMRLALAKVWHVRGYDGMTNAAYSEVLPLINKNLSSLDRQRLFYFINRHVYDLDKGIPKEWPSQYRRAEIAWRAENMASLLSKIILAMEQAAFRQDDIAKVKDLRQHFSDLKQGDEGEYWDPREKITITIKRPVFGENASKKKVTKPLLDIIDVFFAKVVALVNRPFALDGSHYVFDNASMSSQALLEHIMAIAIRCLKEKNNPNFNTDGGGVVGFAKEELSKAYMRSEKYFKPVMDTLHSLMGQLQPILGPLGDLEKSLEDDAKRFATEYKNNLLDPVVAEDYEGGESS